MGQVKDNLSSVFEQKYHSHSIEPTDLDDQYLLYFDRLIQVSALAIDQPNYTDEVIEELAKKLVYLHDHLSLTLNTTQQLFFESVREPVREILQLSDKPAICKRSFYVLAIELIIFCQDFDSITENTICSIADYIIYIRTQNFNAKIFTRKQKRLYAQLRMNYQYYLKRGL